MYMIVSARPADCRHTPGYTGPGPPPGLETSAITASAAAPTAAAEVAPDSAGTLRTDRAAPAPG